MSAHKEEFCCRLCVAQTAFFDSENLGLCILNISKENTCLEKTLDNRTYVCYTYPIKSNKCL